MAPIIVWFRQDLRLSDNPALAAALAAKAPIIPLYILDDETPGDWRPGGAARWWLERSLEKLSTAIADCGSRLILRRGAAAAVLDAVIAETGAQSVFWNRLYEPFHTARDAAIKSALLARGLKVQSHNASLLREPWEVQRAGNAPFRVFTPFWKAASAQIGDAMPLAAPGRLPAPGAWPATAHLADWKLYPARPDWAASFPAHWQPGEAGARDRLAGFIDSQLAGYAEGRDRPDQALTSRLSPHLHWGEISPRQVWQAARMAQDAGKVASIHATKFVAELGWREFSYHLLHHFPHITTRNFKEEFDGFPWSDDVSALRAWQRGETGYPIVDAGLRELWTTGYMHNRVRMIAASFLVKHLLVPWQRGAEWFWDTLVDADLASNSASWQWVAGSGADAAPYFRIFNPVLQGRKFDPDGAYVRRWIPELGGLGAAQIHAPWEAPASTRRAYPDPVISLERGRARALEAFARIKKPDPA